MHRYQDSGKRNRRKGKTEHVTSPVGQMPEGALSFRAIVLTNEGWPQVLGDIYEVFHLVEGRFASASATAAYPNDRQVDVRCWTRAVQRYGIARSSSRLSMPARAAR